MSDKIDHFYMARALRLAERGLFTTDPNPRVGCVLVRDQRVVGEGWHREAGAPHAEINALDSAGAQARGATAYVTLEPCRHTGRTGPCTQALIAAGVRRVVAATLDPNPDVSGRGFEELTAVGIEVTTGVLEHEVEALNPGFFSRMQRGQPWVRCKLAMSLDGRTAMASGESQWITGPQARRDVQRLRARSSAILTGVGTVLADNPSLTVRWEELGAEAPGAGYTRQPLRVVADTHRRTPVDAKMLGLPGATLVATAATDAPLSGADVVPVGEKYGHLDLAALLKLLAEREINEVLLESGATLGGAMLKRGLIDEIVIYMAPTIMGAGARGLFTLPGLERMSDRIALEITDVRAVGNDWRITAHASSPAQ